jgi:hypothetical protein
MFIPLVLYSKVNYVLYLLKFRVVGRLVISVMRSKQSLVALPWASEAEVMCETEYTVLSLLILLQQTWCNAAHTNRGVCSNPGLGFPAFSRKQTYPTIGDSSAVLTAARSITLLARLRQSTRFVSRPRSDTTTAVFLYKPQGEGDWKFSANPFCNLTQNQN